MNYANKPYLSEIIEQQYPDLDEKLKYKNLLLISPCGSGKTRFIFDYLFSKGRLPQYLYLCDTINLKHMAMYEDTVWDSKKLSYNEDGKLTMVKGFGVYHNTTVMTYSEFGHKIENIYKYSNIAEYYEVLKEFISQWKIIVADEIHNLFYFNEFTKGNEYSNSIGALRMKYDTTKIIWMTATPSKIYSVRNKANEFKCNYGNFDYEYLDKFGIIEYTKDDVKAYYNIEERYFCGYKHIQNICLYRKDYFKYMNGKVLIYTSKIGNMLKIQDIIKDIEYIRPICIWSEKTASNTPMSDEQMNVKNYLIKNEAFPDEYNCIIINDAIMTGVNISDPNINLFIANSSNETKIIQSRGRIRHDISLAIIRTEDKEKINLLEFINLDNVIEEYLGRNVFKEELEQFIKKYNLYDEKNRKLSVSKLLKQLKNNGYEIKSKTKMAKGERYTVYNIKKIPTVQ